MQNKFSLFGILEQNNTINILFVSEIFSVNNIQKRIIRNSEHIFHLFTHSFAEMEEEGDHFPLLSLGINRKWGKISARLQNKLSKKKPKVQMTVSVGQEERCGYREWMGEHSGGRGGWDELRARRRHIRTTTRKMNSQWGAAV